MSYLHKEGDVYSVPTSVSCRAPMFPSTSSDFRGRWCYNRETHFRVAETVSAKFDQCTFVRYHTMRFRALFRPKVTRAGAGSRDLTGSAGRQGWTSPESTAQPGDGSTTAYHRDTGGRLGPTAGSTDFESGVLDEDTSDVRFLWCPSVSDLKLATRTTGPTIGMLLRTTYSR